MTKFVHMIKTVCFASNPASASFTPRNPTLCAAFSSQPHEPPIRMNRAKLCIRFSMYLRRRDHRSLPSLFRHFQCVPNSSAQPPFFSYSFSRLSPGFRVSETFPYTDNLKCFCSQPCANEESKCWSCGSSVHSRPALVCESCGRIQPVDNSVNYFQIFGLEKKYDFEEGSLKGKFQDWQKKLHPDLVHSKPEREREYAAEQSARVIDACRTLNNPLLRAIYLMELQGIAVDEEQTIFEPDLLAEIMEIREAVEEATDLQTLKQMQSQVLEKVKHWSNNFSSAYQNQDTEEAVNCIHRLKYYQRVIEEIENKLHNA